ncbi:hypothetical protein [Coprothermobacter platensis]|uniref:hypothetical protein n=1 Tax=Coprothermobacter platensis TaxID=108819 RepID=UPI00037FE63D|nr:hypothetical protein [Coprothermobacter platensis]
MSEWAARLEQLVGKISAPIAVVGPDWSDAYVWVKQRIGNVSPQNLLELQEETLGIDAVREAEEFLSFVPGAELKYLLVPGADNLTPEAQNAFLKTLEEPPIYARIFLFCQRWSSLLPTVRSRVVSVTLAPKSKEELGVTNHWEYLMCGGSKKLLQVLRENIDWAKDVKGKKVLFCKDLDSYKLAAFFLQLMNDNGKKINLLNDMFEMENALQSNVNKEMVFDRMLMTGVTNK